MTDREMLELAALAAGHLAKADASGVWIVEDDGSPVRRWNPLTDDGDALRLAVKLRIQVTPGTYNKDEFTAYSPMHAEAHERWAGHLKDEYAATRRAITRAAAEIGKQLSAHKGGA